MFIIEWFTEPASFEFMQRALLVAVVVGVACAVLSCWLTLLGWSLMGDAVSHAVLAGRGARVTSSARRSRRARSSSARALSA